MQSSSRMEKICANLFLIMVTIFLMLVFCEIMMRCFLFHPTYNFQTSGMLNGKGGQLKVELIPDNLYEIKPNRSLGINKYGFRDHDFSTQKNAMKRICFLGDSFIMGLNVRSEETMPKMLEKSLKDYEVYNMGVVGFGPDQELNVLEKYGFHFKPDMVIESICALNDSGDIYVDHIFTVDANGGLEVTKINPVRSMVFPSSFAIVNQINFIKNKDEILGALDSLLFGDSYDLTWMKYGDSNEAKFKFTLMKAILEKMRDEVNKRNINFLAIIIPSYENICNDKYLKDNNVDPNNYFMNEEMYRSLLDHEKIPNINLAPFFMHLDKDQRCRLYDAGNGHLSPFGNLYAAQVISFYMASQGLTKNESGQ